MALNDGRLTNGWNSNLEKQVSAHEFSLETDRHPPGIHLFGDKWLIVRFFIKQRKRAGAQLFYADGGSTSTEDEKPVFHPTNGREGKTRTLFGLPSCAVFCPTSDTVLRCQATSVLFIQFGSNGFPVLRTP